SRLDDGLATETTSGARAGAALSWSGFRPARAAALRSAVPRPEDAAAARAAGHAVTTLHLLHHVDGEAYAAAAAALVVRHLHQRQAAARGAHLLVLLQQRPLHLGGEPVALRARLADPRVHLGDALLLLAAGAAVTTLHLLHQVDGEAYAAAGAALVVRHLHQRQAAARGAHLLVLLQQRPLHLGGEPVALRARLADPGVHLGDALLLLAA